MPYTDSVFYVRDDSYTDAETFKAAMSGVELVYELATPLEYVLDTPVLMEYNTDGGTEQIVFSENLLSTPLVADVDYFNTAIKHIQFSDETHCIRDERITGVDYIPTEHSTNVVTSAGVYNAVNNVDHLVPLQSKTWTSTWYSGSQYTGHYFMKVRPTDWNKIAVLKYRIRCSIQNVAGSGCDSIVTYQFAKGATPVYYTYNARVDSTKLAFSAHYVYVLNETGFNAINTAGHILGVKIDGTSYQWSSAYRVFTIDILYCDNCTVTFYDSDSNASIRENANYYSGIAISSAIGLQKTGDANSTYANYSFGNSYGICTTVEETLAKTSAISNYILTQGAVTTIYFENAVPASSTLNVNTRGAKPIYYKNEPITNNIIKAGDTATFRYTSDVLSSGAYMLVALDRDFNDFVVAKALNDLESTKEDLEHKVTSLTPFSTDIQYPSAKAVYDHINTQLTSVLNAAQTAAYNEIHPKIGTTQPQDGFEPNVVYDLGTITGSVTFALVSPTDNTITNPYHWTFETGSTAPTITWPNGLTWAGGIAPTIAASKHYEVLVRNGYANVLEF